MRAFLLTLVLVTGFNEAASGQVSDPPAATRVAPDVPLHVLGGWLAAGAGYGVAIETDLGSGERVGAALAAGALAGLGKEAFDAWVQEERADPRDLAASAFGAALFAAFALAAGP